MRSASCSFCGKALYEVRGLLPGPPSVFICNECIDLCRNILAEEMEQEERAEFVSEELTVLREQISEYLARAEASFVPVVDEKLDVDAARPVTVSQGERREDSDMACSFCGKGKADVQKLIAGPTVYICDACVRRCGDILAKTSQT